MEGAIVNAEALTSLLFLVAIASYMGIGSYLYFRFVNNRENNNRERVNDQPPRLTKQQLDVPDPRTKNTE